MTDYRTGNRQDNANLDRELQELIEEIKQLSGEIRKSTPEERNLKRKEKQRKMGDFIDKVCSELNKTKLSLNAYVNKYGERYRFLYEEALQDTLTNVFKNIEKYDPQRQKVIAWVTAIHRNNLNKHYQKWQKRGMKEVPSQGSSPVVSLDALNCDLPTASQPNQKCLSLREFIERDPEAILKKHKTTNNVTLQKVLLMIFDGYKWEEIAKKCQIPISTVSSFYSRSLKKPEISDYFARYLR